MKRIVLLLLLGFGLMCNTWAQAEQRLAILASSQPAVLRTDDVTSNPSFIHWSLGLELKGSSFSEKANDFFSKYSTAFGVKNSRDAFLLEQSITDKAGNTHLKFHQFFNGIPFFGGEFQLHFNRRGDLQTFSGVIFTDPAKASSPEINYFDALSSAIRFMDKNFSTEDLSHLKVQETELQYYHQGLAMGKLGEQNLAYAILLSNQENIREYVFVDAKGGQAIAHFPANCDLLHRRLYLENKQTELWREGESLPGTLDDPQQLQLKVTNQTYQFFANTFQYNSFDNLDSEMELIDQASFLNCPNASWNGSSVNFCPNIGSDDVIAHEWGHAYTEHTSQLLYAWEAGAINEAYSDIWGETIDLLNGDENQEEIGIECNDHIRWKIAEDATAIEGPLRDMMNPNCHNDPAKLTDTLYHCSTDDYGGIHTNSGVVNHAYALLVDGGTYNGYTIEGIGLTKAAHVFWHAQRYYLTRTSNFAALADALEASCFDLSTHNLDSLSISHAETSLSGQHIGSFDSLQLHNVLLAVEMRTPPDQCEIYAPALINPTPVLCPQEDVGFDPFFRENFEQGSDSWIVEELPGNQISWQSRNWYLADNLPENRDGKAMYAPTPHIGDCDTDLNQGVLRLQSPLISIPDDLEGDVFLTFNHYFSFENRQDGGNLKVKRNANPWLNIPPSGFIHNGYNEYINDPLNPLINQKVFTGANQGSVAGNWGVSQINLAVLGVKPGDDISIRWEVGTDGCDGWDGWYIDEIVLGTCSAAAALPVDYLYFRAKRNDKKVTLNWETTSENNNKGFHIERSIDGHRFQTIGWVAAHASQRYEFIDAELPQSHQFYYRLRQEDHDGKVDFSDIKVINGETLNDWRVYPNPASTNAFIDLGHQTSFPVNIKVLSISGQIVKESIIEQESKIISIPTSQLHPGLYLIQLQANETVSYKHLLVVEQK